jgi:allantoinase
VEVLDALEVMDALVRAERVITPEGERAACIGIRGGRIARVDPPDVPLPAAREHHVGADVVVMPGLVDTHVHLQEPGNSSWEGFDSGTRAAAAGGITTVVDMPLDSLPVTVDIPALEAKRRAARGRCHVDVGFWAGVTPFNLRGLRELHDAGVYGFKCFLANTGLPEFPPVTAGEMATALGELSGFGAVLAVHAEDEGVLAATPEAPSRSYLDFLAAHPEEGEVLAVTAVIAATRASGGRSHIVHTSTARAAELVRAAQRDGVRVTAETCPHYLALTSADVPDGDTSFKACPPFRDPANRDALWQALLAGPLGMVVSDHSPCAVEHKALRSGDFAQALGGVSSLQVSLPVVWTHARRRGVGLSDVADWMARRPAEVMGLEGKGAIAPGNDADLCFLAPDETFTVDPAQLMHRHPITPYAGQRLYGVVRETWLRGRRVDFTRPGGELLTRGRRVASLTTH